MRLEIDGPIHFCNPFYKKKTNESEMWKLENFPGAET